MGGRPSRLISDGDIDVIVAAATTRPEKLASRSPTGACAAGRLFSGRPEPVRIGRERLRQLLHARGILPADQDLEGSADPDKEAKLDRIEHVTSDYPDRASPSTSSGRCPSGPATALLGSPQAPVRLRATYHRTTASATSTAVLPGDDRCGAWSASTRRRSHPGRAEVHPAARPGGYRLLVILDACGEQDPAIQALGPSGRTSSYALRRRTRPGPTRSRRNSVLCAPLSWVPLIIQPHRTGP